MISTEIEPENAIQTEKPRRHRKLVIQDAEFVALQCSRGLTETDACHLRGIKPELWFRFKNRVKMLPKINKLFARALGSRKHNLLGEMEKAACGTGGVRHDWRAAQALAGIVDPRLGGQQQPAQPTTSVSIDEPALRRIAEICERTRQAMLQDAASVALLDDAAPAGATDQVNQVIDCPTVMPVGATVGATVMPAGTSDWPAGKD